MKNAPAGLKDWLATHNVAYRADLITLTLLDGTTTYRWTTADAPVLVDGVTWLSAGSDAPLVQRGPFSQSSRLTIDTLDLTITGGSFQINGKSLGQLAREQFFRGSRVRLDHLIGEDLASAVAIPSFFEGRVATIVPAGASVMLRVKSELVALNQQTPKFLLQPACGNVIYDAACGVNRASYTLTGTASGSPTTTTVPTATSGITAKAAGYFELGVLKFTSGSCNGLRRAVRTWSGNIFTLAVPLPTAPAAGDAFTVYPGCDRKKPTCIDRFNNEPQFRGYLHVPAPEGGS